MDDEVFPPLERINHFKCILMGFLLSFDDNFALQRFRWNGLSSSSRAPLYLMLGFGASIHIWSS